MRVVLQVPYGQVRPLGHEGLVDFGGAAMQQGWQIYANPPNLAGPTPVSTRFFLITV